MKEFLTNLSIKYKIIILASMLIIIVIVFGALYKYYYAEDDNTYIENEIKTEENSSEYEGIEENSNTIEIKQTNNRIGKVKSEKTIWVHVIGEVQTPGVVELEEGSRIIDAIEKAGGKTEDADLSKINLAYVIEDGVQIYVPRIGEDMNNITQISEEAGVGIITQTSKQEDAGKTIKVNINTANLEKLQTLPGVGNATAQKILDYKKEHGNFKNIEEIKNVSGIGESKFNNLKNYIVVK